MVGAFFTLYFYCVLLVYLVTTVDAIFVTIAFNSLSNAPPVKPVVAPVVVIICAFLFFKKLLEDGGY